MTENVTAEQLEQEVMNELEMATQLLLSARNKDLRSRLAYAENVVDLLIYYNGILNTKKVQESIQSNTSAE